MYGMRKNFTGFVSLYRNGELIYEYYYSERRARTKKIQEWKEKIKRIEGQAEYHIQINPSIPLLEFVRVEKILEEDFKQ